MQQKCCLSRFTIWTLFPAFRPVHVNLVTNQVIRHSSIFRRPFGSEGTIENGPAFQRRDRLEKSRVPQGRLKLISINTGRRIRCGVFSAVPAGLWPCGTFPGVETPAIVNRRSATPAASAQFSSRREEAPDRPATPRGC